MNTQTRNPIRAHGKMYCGKVKIVRHDGDVQIKPVFLRNPARIEQRPETIKVNGTYCGKGSITRISWENVSIMEKQDGKCQVVETTSTSPENRKVLAEGTYTACIMFVGSARKIFANNHEEELQGKVELLLLEVRDRLELLSGTDDPTNIKQIRAEIRVLLGKVKEMASWVNGSYHRDVIENIREVIEDIRSLMGTADSSVATSEVTAEIAAAV